MGVCRVGVSAVGWGFERGGERCGKGGSLAVVIRICVRCCCGVTVDGEEWGVTVDVDVTVG